MSTKKSYNISASFLLLFFVKNALLHDRFIFVEKEVEIAYDSYH